MRKQRGLVFIFVGVIIAAVAGLFVYQTAQRIASQPPQVVVQKESIPRVFVVVATRDLAEDEKLAAGDVTTREFPVDFVPEGAVASTDVAVGKYASGKILRGQIVVSSFLKAAPKPPLEELAARIPSGKVAMSVTVMDALNQIGVLRPGDHVDILLTIDLKEGLAKEQTNQQGAPKEERLEKYVSTQLTMQDVEILLIGPPEVTPTATAAPSPTPLPPTPAPGAKPEPTRAAAAAAPTRVAQPTAVPEVAQKTITFLLNHQEAVTLKYIKDSGGTMDLILRSRGDKRLVKTDPMSIDALYQQFRFRFPEPIKQAGGQ